MKLKLFCKSLVYEYITNHIIVHLPSRSLRHAYYQKILNIHMDKSVFIQMGCYIYNSPGDFYIGLNTIINRNCTLDRRGGLYIGQNVNISPDVAIFTAGHDPNSCEFQDFIKTVVIEDYVWLGTKSMIMPGVTIKEGAVVLPGAIVTHNVEAYSIVGGIPARSVGVRTRNLRYTLSWRPRFT